MEITDQDLVALDEKKIDFSQRERLLPALGIDFGTKFVGIALAAAPLAQPLTVLPNNADVLSYICTLIDDYQVRTVVVGISENKTADLTRAFARQLAATVTVSIEFADETLSTQVAREKLRATGKRYNPNERVDHYAAAELLQEWLDSHEDIS